MSEVENEFSQGSKDLWDEIGFHRPLGGFWFRLVLELGIILIPAVVMSFLLKILYPFPTSRGYSATFTGIFVLVFTIFDIGTSNTISRFIAEENIKNPLRMVQYIQYFIWYQAITGLVQITGISIWALFFVPDTNLAFGIWIMLICITKQWPGFPGVFKGVLNSLQLYNKRATIDFIQSEGIQRITEIVFVLLGKWYGQTHPEIGMILGISIGAVFGLYLDDFIASIFAGWYLAKSMQDYNISFLRLFRIEFGWDIVKECFTFGLKTGFPGLITAGTKMIALSLSLIYIPQYTTFIVLADMANMLMATSERLVKQDFTPLFTEAYQNGKIELCKYYNAHAMRFYMLNTGFSFAIMLTVISIFRNIFLGLGLDLYLLTIPFLIPALIFRASKVYNAYPDSILIATHRPNQVLILRLFEEIGKIIAIYLTIVVFRIPELGVSGIVYTLVLGEFPIIVIKSIIAYVYIHKKIFKLDLMYWQTFVVPPIATAILFGIFFIFKETVLFRLWDINFYLSLGVSLIVILILVLGFYFPLTVFLGGWDDNSIRDFRKVKKMAGPSKPLVVPMADLIFKTVPISKLHNKFKYDESAAKKELEELVQTRNKNREIYLKGKYNKN